MIDSSKNKKYFFLYIILALFGIIFLSLMIILANIAISTPSSPPYTQSNYEYYSETVDDVEWQIKYDTTNNKIVLISANYTETDKSSKYWQEIARKYGDNSLYVLHKVNLVGTPMDDNWYKIEKQETYIFANDVLGETTTRFEQKITFTTLS